MKKLFIHLIWKSLPKFLRYRRLVEISSIINFPLVSPLVAEVKVTNKCNLRCKYCDIWKHQDKTWALSVKQLTEIFASLRKLGVRIVTITGGEPLLHPNLQKIIIVAKNHHLRTHIITKGALLTRDKALKLVEAGASCIILSLDTLNPETYAKLTGISFNFAEEALETLLYVKEKYPNVDVAVNCVINRYNIGEVVDFAKKITEYSKGKILMNFQPYQRIPSITKYENELVPPKMMFPILVKEVEMLIKMKAQGFPITDSEVFLRRIPKFLIFGELPMTFKCKAGYVGVFICDHLQVRPCYQLPAVSNLYEKSLENIWFSYEFRKQRRKMREGKCRGCLLLCHNEESWYDWYDKIDKSFKKSLSEGREKWNNKTFHF